RRSLGGRSSSCGTIDIHEHNSISPNHIISFRSLFSSSENLLKRHTRSFRYLSPTPLSVELHFFTRYRWPVWTKCVRYMMPLLLTFRMVCPSPWAAVWNRSFPLPLATKSSVKREET